jgi:predicted DNA-binding protein with PD1-like motif
MASASSAGVFYAFRLRPHDDLKKGILQFVAEHKINAGAIVSCVGSLERVSIRYANQSKPSELVGHFEILSLTGTLSSASAHLHISVADKKGQTTGGHLMENSQVFTTAEIVVLCFPDLEFARALDDSYGYHELVIRPKSHEH